MMIVRKIQKALAVAVLACIPVLMLPYLCLYGTVYRETTPKHGSRIAVFLVQTDNQTRTVKGKRVLRQVPVMLGDIVLVNKDHPLPADYEVELLTLPDRVNQADRKAYDSLVAMLRDGQKQGLQFEICSSYRSVRRQMELFDEDVYTLMLEGYTYEEAYKEVEKETMPPGCSEHSTGLAFDIVALDYQLLDQWQEMTPENIWLQENCARFGFILRYPRGKEEITRISYESWHFRYVGVESATYITEKGITLEEYFLENGKSL